MSSRVGFWMNIKTIEQVPICYRIWRSHDAFDRSLRPRVFDIKISFESHTLDSDQRVLSSRSDFIKNLETMIATNFTHKTVIEDSDPDVDIFKQLHDRGLLDIVIVPNQVGAESFAHGIFNWIKAYLIDSNMITRVDVRTVDVVESRNNTAVYVE